MGQPVTFQVCSDAAAGQRLEPPCVEIQREGGPVERRATTFATFSAIIEDGSEKEKSKLGSDEPGQTGPNNLRQVSQNG